MNTEYLFWKDLIGVHCVSGSGSYTHLFIQHTLFTSEVFGIKVLKGCLLSKLEKNSCCISNYKIFQRTQ